MDEIWSNALQATARSRSRFKFDASAAPRLTQSVDHSILFPLSRCRTRLSDSNAPKGSHFGKVEGWGLRAEG